MSQDSKTPKIEKGGSRSIDKGQDSVSGSSGKRRSLEKGELRGMIGKCCNITPLLGLKMAWLH